MTNLTQHPTLRATIAAATMLPILMATFLAFEPTVTSGQEEFTVRQQINEEIAFTVAPQDVIMDTQLQGLTGGISNGSTTFAITTNNSAGYTVTAQFASTTAMEHETSGAFIPNLGSSVVPDFNTGAVTGSSAFGYSITGPQIATVFGGNTTSCNSGGTGDADACWLLQAAAEGAFTIIDSSLASDSAGDSYDMYFRVVVDQNPSPALPEGFYTATTTLTATNK